MYNKVILIGNIGKDPEIKELTSTSKASFPLATSERVKGKDGAYKDMTEWHNIVIWGDNAKKISEYTKGDRVLIEGKIKTESWGEQEAKKYKTIIECFIIKRLKKNGENTEIDLPF